MKKFKLLHIGTSGLSDQGDIDRIVLVNTLCLITASSIITVGYIVCNSLHWKLSLVLPFIAEFILNGSVLLFNHYKKRKAASGMLYFLQCGMIIYLSYVLGRLLRLEIVVVLLFSINYLIFKDKRLRTWGWSTALATLIALEVIYYFSPAEAPINLSYTTTYIIQALVIFAMTVITILISRPYVKSNDTNEELKRANHLIKIFVA